MECGADGHGQAFLSRPPSRTRATATKPRSVAGALAQRGTQQAGGRREREQHDGGARMPCQLAVSPCRGAGRHRDQQDARGRG
jgi:hypothetical protein